MFPVSQTMDLDLAMSSSRNEAVDDAAETGGVLLWAGPAVPRR